MQVHKESTVVSPEEVERLLQEHRISNLFRSLITPTAVSKVDQRGFIIGSERL